MIEQLSGRGTILNRKLVRHYRRLLTESAGGGGIAPQMHARKVILRASVGCRQVGSPERKRPGAKASENASTLRLQPLNKRGVGFLMETARMSDHDRLDRMERKLNRIGKYVLFGIALFTVLLAVEMQRMSSDIFFGYGRFALWSFIGVMTVMLLVARTPFRD
jgi:hypothetical protein